MVKTTIEVVKVTIGNTLRRDLEADPKNPSGDLQKLGETIWTELVELFPVGSLPAHSSRLCWPVVSVDSGFKWSAAVEITAPHPGIPNTENRIRQIFENHFRSHQAPDDIISVALIRPLRLTSSTN